MTRIVAYTYEAACHCPECTAKRFEVYRTRALFVANRLDEHGVWIEAIDREGNPVHPVFSTDERGDSITHCGDCGGELQ